MSATLDALRQQNTREVYLLPEADGLSARSVPPGTPGALPFLLARVNADRIRANLLFAALGRDTYVAYAAWYSGEAQKEHQRAEAAARKDTDPPPFDDAPEDDAEWRAYTVALEDAAELAVLEVGLLDPPFAEAAVILGPYRTALVRQIVMWDREGVENPKSLSGNSEPP